MCQAGRCAVPGCSDVVKNGPETDLDCGGGCGACADGLSCSVAADCRSSVCQGMGCAAPSCSDGRRNGTETGVDCGGTCQLCVPADPAAAAPPLDPTVVPSLFGTTSFLYTGASPVQTGVLPGAISPTRVAHLRGRVLAPDGTGLRAARVAVHQHAEFGETLTRDDGRFDLMFNGGPLLTVRITKPGYLPVDRQAALQWQDTGMLDDVTLTAVSATFTRVDFSAPVQEARGEVITDSSGTRRATLLFSQGTTATVQLADGGTRPLPGFNVRATEFTVGPSGRSAMPAELPPNSDYTYAVAYTADEVEAAGGGRGRVVKLLSVTQGLADLDVDGAGTAADAARRTALDLTDPERAKLAQLYAVGATLWRVPIAHFTSYDFNFSLGDDTSGKQPDPPPPPPKKKDDPCEEKGSIIECENQVLGERLELTGTSFALRYQSDRVPGYTAAYIHDFQITDGTPPAALTRAYDGDLLTSITWSGAVAGSVAVAYNADFSPVSETVNGASALTFAYDAVGRLISSTSNGLTTAYGYNLNGNRTRVDLADGGSVTATHDAQDRVLTHGPLTFVYDATGTLMTRTHVPSGQVTAYDYDALGNLRRVDLPDGRAIEYLVDGWGRRIGKRVNGALVQGLLYGARQTVTAELDGSGAVMSRFIYGERVLAPDAMIRGGVTYRIVSDPIGSVRLVIDAATGAVAQRIDYDAFGTVTLDTNPGFQPFGFAGGLYEPSTGLVRFGARDYLPEVGRWTAKDPIGFDSGETNLYTYVENDPVNKLDPQGEDAVIGGRYFWDGPHWWILIEDPCQRGKFHRFDFTPSSTAPVSTNKYKSGLDLLWMEGEVDEPYRGKPEELDDAKKMQPTRARYRHHRSSPGQDQAMLDRARELQANPRQYSLALYNCWDFVMDVLMDRQTKAWLPPDKCKKAKDSCPQ